MLLGPESSGFPSAWLSVVQCLKARTNLGCPGDCFAKDLYLQTMSAFLGDDSNERRKGPRRGHEERWTYFDIAEGCMECHRLAEQD